MSIEKKVMITAVVNYGYPICRSLFVHAENTLEASEKADKYMKDERNDIYFAIEVTIEGTQKVFLVYINDLQDFFSNGVDYGFMNNASTYTFDTYEQFCKWCSYNLKS